LRRATVSATVEKETPVVRATWRQGSPASSFRRRISLVFRVDTLPYANPTSPAFADELEYGPSEPCVASGPFVDSAHEARSDRLGGRIGDRLGPEYAPHCSWSNQRWGCPHGRQIPSRPLPKTGKLRAVHTREPGALIGYPALVSATCWQRGDSNPVTPTREYAPSVRSSVPP